MFKIENENEFNIAVKYYQNRGYKGNPPYNKNVSYVGISYYLYDVIYAWHFCVGETNPLPKAIEVNNKKEIADAVQFFKDCGYNAHPNPIYDPNTKYVVIVSGYVNYSNGTYVKNENIPVMKLKEKEKQMTNEVKVGDIIQIKDYSWSKILRNGGIHTDYCNISDRYEAKWKVLETNGKYPVTYHPSNESKYQNNDMVCSRIDNPNCFVIINSLFAYLPEDPIMVGNDKVQFNEDGSIKVGCTTVDAKTLDKIVAKLGYKT